MTLSMVVAWVLLAQLVAFWALALMVWLVAELSGVEDVTFSRSVATSMFVLAINFALIGVAAAAQAAFDWVNSPPLALGLFASLGLVQIVLPVFVFRYYLHTSFPRALLLWVAGMVAMIAAGVLMSVGIRAKVAEVVTIANNNMAPTLRAEYAELACANCGHVYTAGISKTSLVDNPNGPAGAPVELVCPRCGFANAWPVAQPLHEADRVLVDRAAKPTKDPSWRWKIVAYRPPINERTTHVGRVVGLPDETVQISGGDIFINLNRLQKKPEDAPDLWIPVYDSNVRPQTPVAGGPGWKPYEGAGWEEKDGRWMCRAGNQTRELAFTQVITDAPTYDSPRDLPRNFRALPARDVQITCTVEQFSGEGLFGFRWDYGENVDNTVISCGVRIWPQGGQILKDDEGRGDASANRLRAVPKGMRYQLVSQPVERRPGDPPRNPELTDNLPVEFQPGMKFSFGVRDGVTYVAHNGQTLAVLPVEPLDVEEATAFDAKPHHWNMLRIVARNCQISLGRIAVERDVYYRTIPEMGEKAGIATPNGNRNPTALAPNEFLILGDNSAHSIDSRFYGPIASPYTSGAVRSIVWPRDRWLNLP